MIFYFAGAEHGSAGRKLRSHGVESILQSAFYLHYRKPPNAEGFPRCIVDSGGFTVRKTGQHIDPETYARWLLEHKVELAFNLDTLDLAESIENQRRIQAIAHGTYLIPVYHYPDWTSPRSRDALRRFADESPFVSIAGLRAPTVKERARFYDFCFSVVKDRSRIHGLGATVTDHLLQYPFYSVDSTTWLSSTRYGEWHEYQAGRIVKHRSLKVVARLPNRIVTSPNQMNFETERYLDASIKAFRAFEAHVTRLWAARGVIWNDFDPRRCVPTPYDFSERAAPGAVELQADGRREGGSAEREAPRGT